MMVTFVSECEKKALNRTRRVLDAFANRIGSRTWQTVITHEGLQAVKKLLRKTASKNSAVSCHWIRSRSRSELVWIVGNRRKFNSEGVVPVNRTQKEMPTLQSENDWHSLPLIQALTAISALLHDWGKSSALFQDKLKHHSRLGDPVRHEWISCLLLNALVTLNDSSSDSGWLESLVHGSFDEEEIVGCLSTAEKRPLDQLPPVAKLVAWLIVSHHRLPLIDSDQEDWRGEKAADIDFLLKRITQEWGYENRYCEEEYQQRVADCFQFPNGLLSNSSRWMSQLKKWGQRLQEYQQKIEMMVDDGSYRVLLHHARLCLMMGDHYYSSQDADQKWQEVTGLFANTDRTTKKLKQKLDEHLFGVAKSALRTAYLLPTFESSMAVAHDIRMLGKRSPKEFAWQDKAVAQLKKWRESKPAAKQGFFAVNMASTGSGKTFANAKIMRSISENGETLRYILALGLRTLTLQTGDEYRNRIGLDESELAVLIGSRAVTELHHQDRVSALEEDGLDAVHSGSESSQPLLDEYIDYECDIPEEGLETVLTQERDRQFLYAPVLACTIDHLMAATETRRGGRYILPSLRLLSSDLVIDEIDDFTGSDLIAIGRLIHLAGMLGRKVMISSATIPPDLAEGYLHAYQQGWKLYAQTRDAGSEILCAWIDEFSSETQLINDNGGDMVESYRAHHAVFIDKRVKKLNKQPAKCKAEIVECREEMEALEFDEEESKQQQYFSIIKQAAIEKHQHHHTIDQQSDIAVSFGVVRMANITPCVELTKYLLQHESGVDVEIRAMAYHSQQILLLRHQQEQHLDSVLRRKEQQESQPASFSNETVRNHLNHCTVKNLLFILVATPVEEVGRDHDFDWAVVEPSSYRSIIQLAGRVRRHRSGEVNASNIALLQYNWKAFRDGDKEEEKYFNRPGYEEKLTLESHDLYQLINSDDIALRLDAVPRISKREPLDYSRSLADLEHVVTQSELASYHRVGPETLQGYLNEAWYLTALPQHLNPFRKGEKSTNLFYVSDPESEDCFFAEKNEQGYPVNREEILRISHVELGDSGEQNLWLPREYKTVLQKIADRKNISMRIASLRFGEINFVLRDNVEYQYSDQFGLVKF